MPELVSPSKRLTIPTPISTLIARWLDDFLGHGVALYDGEIWGRQIQSTVDFIAIFGCIRRPLAATGLMWRGGQMSPS